MFFAPGTAMVPVRAESGKAALIWNKPARPLRAGSERPTLVTAIRLTDAVLDRVIRRAAVPGVPTAATDRPSVIIVIARMAVADPDMEARPIDGEGGGGGLPPIASAPTKPSAKAVFANMRMMFLSAGPACREITPNLSVRLPTGTRAPELVPMARNVSGGVGYRRRPNPRRFREPFRFWDLPSVRARTPCNLSAQKSLRRSPPARRRASLGRSSRYLGNDR